MPLGRRHAAQGRRRGRNSSFGRSSTAENPQGLGRQPEVLKHRAQALPARPRPTIRPTAIRFSSGAAAVRPISSRNASFACPTTALPTPACNSAVGKTRKNGDGGCRRLSGRHERHGQVRRRSVLRTRPRPGGQAGEKVVIGDNHVGKVVGSVGDPAKLLAKWKKYDWNDYDILAKGNHIVLKINGYVTADVTDNDKKMRRFDGIIALQLHAGEPMKVQFRNIRLKELGASPPAGREPRSCIPSRGGRRRSCSFRRPAQPRLCRARVLCRLPAVGRPAPRRAADGRCRGLQGNLAGAGARNSRCDRALDRWRRLAPDLAASRPVGSADEAGRRSGVRPLERRFREGQGGPTDGEWIGGYYEPYWSVNPFWTAEFKQLPDHPIARGVAPFTIRDEWYYHMRFLDGMEGVTPILSPFRPRAPARQPDGQQERHPAVRQPAREWPEVVAWCRCVPMAAGASALPAGMSHLELGQRQLPQSRPERHRLGGKIDFRPGGIPSQRPTLEELESQPRQTEAEPTSAGEGRRTRRVSRAGSNPPSWSPQGCRLNEVCSDCEGRRLVPAPARAEGVVSRAAAPFAGALGRATQMGAKPPDREIRLTFPNESRSNKG